MNPFHLIDPSFAVRFTTALLHFVWQGAVIAGFTFLGEFLLRREPARWRYVLHVAAMFVMAAAVPVTFTLVAPSVSKPLIEINAPVRAPANDFAAPASAEIDRGDAGTESSASPVILWDTSVVPSDQPVPTNRPIPTGRPIESSGNASGSQAFDRALRLADLLQAWAPLVTAAYFVCFASLLIRLVHGVWGGHRLRRTAQVISDESLLAVFKRQATRLGLKVVPTLAWCAEVSIPVVVGVLRPMILLPAAAATGLTLDQLQTLLTHELAHIRRYDLLVNLFQRVVESMLFFHPAVWYVSRRISSEREEACDELVLKAGCPPLLYADSLVRMAELSATLRGLGRAAPATSLAAVGSNSSEFKRRVLKILSAPATSNLRPDRATCVIVVASLILGLSLISTRIPYGVLAQDGVRDISPRSIEAQVLTNEGPKSPRDDANSDTAVEPSGRFRGRVVTADGSPLPDDLKLFRRVSGEPTKETAVSRNGLFAFDADPASGSARFSIKSAGFAPFDSSWMKLSETLTLTLSRGAQVSLRMTTPAGSGPLSGKVRLIVPWYDDDEQGEFAVDAQGHVTIPHCPKQTIDLDVRIQGYEELRIHRLVSENLALDVPLVPAKPTRMRIVSAKDGRPIAGAKVRFVGRVRADSFLTPYRYFGNDEIWDASNAQGLVTLTTLRKTDPVPTNLPGAAGYVFRIDAPHHAPRYLADVRAGMDLGDIVLDEPFEVRGEIAHAANERISLQYRQSTAAHGGDRGQGDWLTATTDEVNGTTTFHLTNLQSGPFDLFIVYSDASEPRGSLRGIINQMQFLGNLTGSSSQLRITREAVTPGDGNLTARSESLSPVDADRSNVPNTVVRQFVGGLVATSSDAGPTELQESKPAVQPLLVWSYTAPVQHSLGFVGWRVFILQDGTVFVPGGASNRDAGILHKLAAAELEELKTLLEVQAGIFGKEVPREVPAFAGWRHGHETLIYTKDGITQTFVKWDGLEDVPIAGELNVTGAHQAVTEYLSRLITDAACGGRERRAQFREFANKSLAVVLPNATRFDDLAWVNATIDTDGTRTIRFANTHERTEITLIQPSFGRAYVERIEFQGKRVQFDPRQLGELGSPILVR